MKKKKKDTIRATICTLVTASLFVFLIGPFYLLIINSFKDPSEIARTTPTLYPHSPTLESFQEIFTNPEFLTSIFTSLIVATCTMFIAILLAVPTAYCLCRIPSKTAKGIQWWILLSVMMPGIILIVPILRILMAFSLTSTHQGLIIIHAISALPFGIWMMRGFIASIPLDVEEAAFIDGCNLPKMFLRVLLPTILPGVLTAGVFAFIASWNELFFALTVMRTPDMFTLPIRLQSFVGLGGQAREGILMAGSVLASIPGLIVFLVFQRYFVTGLTSGSVK